MNVKNLITGVVGLATIVFVCGAPCQRVDAEPGESRTGPSIQTANLAVAFPNDARFLLDQIDVEIYIGDSNDKPAFVVAARPSQMLAISLPDQTDSEKVVKYGFLFHPMVNGKPVRDYSLMKDVSNSELTFRIVSHCLEETPGGEPPSKLEAMGDRLIGGCIPRLRYGQSSDDVAEVGAIEGFSIGQKFEDKISGIFFVIKDYKRKTYAGGSDWGPSAKCCVEARGGEVCSCKVTDNIQLDIADLGPESSCNSGCQ